MCGATQPGRCALWAEHAMRLQSDSMRRFVLLADPAPILIIEDDAIRNDEKAMPQKPIAYAADYVHAEENYISMRQRQLMDVAHRHHLEHIEAPIKKDIVLNYTKTNSPNKKKQQQIGN
ncbi:hypothetical protein Ae201684P_003619 [Aphanomyces euteiches]|nr:hypothetical protein Ae201684P_003619 [Aphanomyces euteiches]